jgi:hypothetical protein
VLGTHIAFPFGDRHQKGERSVAQAVDGS